MENIEEICQIFNFKIKAEKNKCIEFPLNGYNVFAMLPTRFGKNVIYTCFPLLKSKYYIDTFNYFDFFCGLLSQVLNDIYSRSQYILLSRDPLVSPIPSPSSKGVKSKHLISCGVNLR